MDSGNPLRLEPLGQSGAAAIVVSALYFIGVLATIANWVVTKFTFYDVVLIACLLRVVGFAARAAYLIGGYHPSLEGIYLAFSNAGYGASLANVFLVTAVWMKKPHPQLASSEQAFYKKFFFIWCLPVIAFGPITGVIASGMLYGDSSSYGLLIGNRLKKAAVWGLFCVCLVYWFLIGRISLATLMSGRRGKVCPTPRSNGQASSDEDPPPPNRQEKLIAVLWVCATLLLMRGIMGVFSAYESVDNDHFYYPLYEIPELLDIIILLQPTLMARIALVYPKPPPEQQQDSEENREDAKRGAKPADVEAGANGTSDAH